MSQIKYSYTKQTTLNNSYNNVINTNNTLSAQIYIDITSQLTYFCTIINMTL